jgi:hypothetical protein
VKKILLALGLFSTTSFSIANAYDRALAFSCYEEKATPDAAQSLSFYESQHTGAGFIDYKYSDLIGRSQLIERIPCSRMDQAPVWECTGQKFVINVMKNLDTGREGIAYVSAIENGKVSPQSKTFYCP